MTIISGPCLFSAPGAAAHLDYGPKIDLCEPGSLDKVSGKVVDITVDNRLQAYEVDSIMRLTQVMSAINTDGKTVHFKLNIPRVEYYFYILDAYEKGLITPDLAIKWFDLVDSRSQGIENLIRRRTPQEFVQEKISPLDGIGVKLRRAVGSGEKDLLRKAISILRTQNLAWIRAIEKTDPQEFTDISNLSYVVANLMVTQDESTLPIVIENPEEEPIVRNLKKMLDGLSVRLLVLYPHSNAIPNFQPKNGKVNNYFFPPQENQLAVLKELVRLNKQT